MTWTPKIGERCDHANCVDGRVFIIASLPDERGWLSYTVEGEDGTQYSGNVRDLTPLGGNA